MSNMSQEEKAAYTRYVESEGSFSGSASPDTLPSLGPLGTF